MQVICLQEDAFRALVDEVVQTVIKTVKQKEDKWISGEEAMQKLRIKSKTTLQDLRDEGKIKFSQPAKKIILYDSESIEAFLEKNSKSPFTFL